jgi:hypothetical protein
MIRFFYQFFSRVNFLSLFLFLILINESLSQNLQAGHPVFEEFLRRQQLLGSDSLNYSFNLRQVLDYPVQFNPKYNLRDSSNFKFVILPILSSTIYNSKRPFGWGNYGLTPSNGVKKYLSLGGAIKKKNFILYVQPELFFQQNKTFEGFSNKFTTDVIASKFFLWNIIDSPEQFSNKPNFNLTLGQSFISYRFRKSEIAFSNRTLWWGPGQWNSLLFSNNAKSFPHVSINSTAPNETKVGNFEYQLVLGKLQSSFIEPSTYNDLNSIYFLPFVDNSRYLNAINVSFNPKILPNLHLGFGRTFMQFWDKDKISLSYLIPIFEGFQKEKFFSNGNSVSYDGKIQSQQMVIFSRYLVPKANFELYFEYGRRDHALNWREFFLNPEHGRAYQLGFVKIFRGNDYKNVWQVRGEITTQSESVNRYMRYDLPGGFWHAHGYILTGFTNLGIPLGVGLGQGSDSQTLELSYFKGFNKLGFIFQRIENNKSFYYMAKLNSYNINPWIDFNSGVIFNHKIEKNIFLDYKINFIFSNNNQWNYTNNSNQIFPINKFYNSLNTQLNFVYLIGD